MSSGKKNWYVRHFKEKHGKLYIIGKVNKCRFREKKLRIAGFFNSAKENRKNDRENGHASFIQINESIGYLLPPPLVFARVLQTVSCQPA